MDIDKWGDSPFDEPTSVLRASDPSPVAEKAGALWFPEGRGEGRVVVPVLSGEVEVRYPGIEVRAPAGLDSFAIKLLTLLYLSKADGTRPSGEWIAYRDLPNARFYEPVVKRSVEDPIVETFGTLDTRRFADAARAWGGGEEEFGDASFSFALFPRVLLCLVLWRCDAEFPARAQVLFDSACPHHLNAFDLRMGAQEISGRLIKEARR
jgi:hypothetical protein